MLYAILCYHDEAVVNSWTQEQDDAVIAKRMVVTKKLTAQGKLGLGIAEIGYGLVGGQYVVLPASAHIVECGVAGDHDEPCGGIARRTVERPVLQRAQAGLLERFLGLVEIAERAQQRADGLGTRGRQRGVDPGDIRHFARAPGSK